MNILRTYNLFLDSSQRDYSAVGNPAEYLLLLNKPITKTGKSSIFKVRIIQACIPFSFTEINETNNVLSYLFNSTPFQMTIPVGSYNITSLLSYIATYLEQTHTVKLSFTFNQSTNLATLGFSLAGNTGTKQFDFPTILNNLLVMKQLGFVNTTATFSYTFGTLFNATSNQSVNVSPSKNLYIRSNSLQQTNSQEAIIGKCRSSNILAVVPINVPFGNYITFYNTQTFSVDINNETIDGIEVFLSDATGENVLVGLQLNWSITIVIDEVDIPDVINVSHIMDNTVSQQNQTSINQLEGIRQNTLDDLERHKGKLIDEIGEIHQKKIEKNNIKNNTKK
jgi:hypothetical protein